MTAAAIPGLIQAASILVSEVRRLLSQAPPDLDIEATRRELVLLENDLADLKRERARLDEALGG
jgi:hypothetical protein